MRWLSLDTAAAIIAETGLDMTRFPTPGHLVSWAGLCPRAIQSGPRTRQAKGHGSTYLRSQLGQAAIGAAKTTTFLGERYRRIARRRGGAKAQVAVARSILVIIGHLLTDPAARYTDLGPGHYETTIDKTAKPAATSTSSKPSATPSPSPRPPEPAPQHRRAPAGSAGAAARPAKVEDFPVWHHNLEQPFRHDHERRGSVGGVRGHGS